MAGVFGLDDDFQIPLAALRAWCVISQEGILWARPSFGGSVCCPDFDFNVLTRLLDKIEPFGHQLKSS